MPQKSLKLCQHLHRFALILATAITVFAQAQVKQGEVLRINDPGATAELNGKTVRIFPEGGLMPIAVTQAPGKYTVVIKDGKGAKLKDLPIEVVDAHYPRQNIQASK